MSYTRICIYKLHGSAYSSTAPASPLFCGFDYCFPLIAELCNHNANNKTASVCLGLCRTNVKDCGYVSVYPSQLVLIINICASAFIIPAFVECYEIQIKFNVEKKKCTYSYIPHWHWSTKGAVFIYILFICIYVHILMHINTYVYVGIPLKNWNSYFVLGSSHHQRLRLLLISTTTYSARPS